MLHEAAFQEAMTRLMASLKLSESAKSTSLPMWGLPSLMRWPACSGAVMQIVRAQTEWFRRAWWPMPSASLRTTPHVWARWVPAVSNWMIYRGGCLCWLKRSW